LLEVVQDECGDCANCASQLCVVYDPDKNLHLLEYCSSTLHIPITISSA
jgi:hypothetical protein